MAFLEGIAPTADTFEDGHRRLFRIVRRFIVGAPEINDVQFSGVGNGVIGKIDTYPSSPAETWTITFTDALNFTVIGGMSGSMDPGTVGADYDNGVIAFRINAGGTPFEAGDAFTVELAASANSGTDVWVEDRYDPHSAALEWIAHGTGLAGTEAIYVGTRMSETPASNLWSLEIRGFTGFDANLDFSAQPGASPGIFMALWNQSHPFWLAVNGRRWILVARVSTTYHACYAGFFLPYCLPSEYPYPLVVGAEAAAPTSWSSTSATFSQFWNPPSGAVVGYRRTVQGTWAQIDGSSTTATVVWPTYTSTTENSNAIGMHLNLIEVAGTGEYPLFPFILLQDVARTNPTARVTHGELDGLFAVPGFNLSAEDVLTIGGDDYLVFQNIFRTDRGNKAALKKA